MPSAGQPHPRLSVTTAACTAIDSALDRAWNHPELVLDVADGDPEGFSLGAGPGPHFVTRSPSGPDGPPCRASGVCVGQPAASG